MAPATAAMVTVLIADPNATMATAIADVLGHEPDISVVGVAAGRGSAARLLTRHHPDVLLLEPAILGRDSLAALPLLQQASPATSIVLIAMDDPATWAHELDRSCAAGYLSKRAPAGTWGDAVIAVARPRLPHVA